MEKADRGAMSSRPWWGAPGIQTPSGSLLNVGRGVPWQACRAGDCAQGVLEAVDRGGSNVYSGTEPRY
jgi:hypothetical protein